MFPYYVNTLVLDLLILLLKNESFLDDTNCCQCENVDQKIHGLIKNM